MNRSELKQLIREVIEEGRKIIWTTNEVSPDEWQKIYGQALLKGLVGERGRVIMDPEAGEIVAKYDPKSNILSSDGMWTEDLLMGLEEESRKPITRKMLLKESKKIISKKTKLFQEKKEFSNVLGHSQFNLEDDEKLFELNISGGNLSMQDFWDAQEIGGRDTTGEVLSTSPLSAVIVGVAKDIDRVINYLVEDDAVAAEEMWKTKVSEIDEDDQEEEQEDYDDYDPSDTYDPRDYDDDLSDRLDGPEPDDNY